MFKQVDLLVDDLTKKIDTAKKAKPNDILLTGVDLGTAYTVITVCDSSGKPLGCSLRRTNVVKDGLVVDYISAKEIVAELKAEVEAKIGRVIENASIAVPSGTSQADAKTHKYVVEGAGINVCSIVDEPTAANKVLNIKDGAVVDVGGGTTGISIFKDGNVVYTADDATGGTHFTYVIAGHYKISFDEAEQIKMDPRQAKDIYTITIPVMQKIASLINKHIKGYNVSQIVLCGGSCRLNGIEKVIEIDTGIKTLKPKDPFLITPLGIALSTEEIINDSMYEDKYGVLYDFE